MRFVMFYHSLVSDWNHGNAHFLRGVASELLNRGHQVEIYEPEVSWSRDNLISEHGKEPVREFEARYALRSQRYDPESIDLDRALEQADAVIAHEWNAPGFIRKLGLHRRNHRYRLFFHDTHHRSVTDPDFIGDHLRDYDGVLAFGESLRRKYLERDWASRVWVWHEAADTRVFQPIPSRETAGDLVWIGNWGDGERTAELDQFLLAPVRALRLKTRVHGVRYPPSSMAALADSGAEYAGWIPNFRVPEVFSEFTMTIHVPRRPYREQLAGIPTIRVFEALACGIPLVCAPWDDIENLFTPGKDYLLARNSEEMIAILGELKRNARLRIELAGHGLTTIRERHSCAHRTDQLMEILQQ
ncbi:MAG: CgeB family protein [Bryobacteraceae bacterium]